MIDASAGTREIQRLFHEHVPEVSNGTVELKSIAREPGQRAIVAVHSIDPAVCPVSSCVGLKGSLVKRIVNELPGEKLDIVKWSALPAEFIRSAIKPATANHIVFNADRGTATIHAPRADLSLITGRLGQRLSLLSQLTGWDLRVIKA